MRVLDLFSGIGGFSLGLESAGMQTIGFCEIEPFPRAVLEKHWPGVPIHDDVRTLSAESVSWLRTEAERGIDLICGGFPCQDISVAGKGAGLKGSRSGLWYEYLRLVQELRPRWVLAENVGALRTRGYDEIAGGLEAEGYAVWPLVVGAWAVGAPHRRERVWIVAHRMEVTDQGRGGTTHRHASDEGRRVTVGGASIPQRGATSSERNARASGRDRAKDSAVGPVGEPTGAGLEGQRTDAGQPQEPEPRDAGEPRWPARPGEPQHEWEEPRRARFGGQLDNPVCGRCERVHGRDDPPEPSGDGQEDGVPPSSGSRRPELPLGLPVDELRRRLARCLVVTDGKTGEAGPREVLRLMQSLDDEEAIQRAVGRPLRVSETTLLRLSMYGNGKSYGYAVLGNPAEQGTAASLAEAALRKVPGHGPPSEASRQQGQERALEDREAQILLDYLMSEKRARRWNREALKALGNSVVPAVVAAIGRAILTAEVALAAAKGE